jgi:tRNA(Ile)-lysidine synthase
MASLPAGFVKTLTGPCGIAPGQGIVAAVSGGPDSMAMLHLLASCRERLQLSLCVAWIDHGLRPRETPGEQALVARTARQLDLPFFVRRVDTAALAQREHLSIEHAARILRYRELRDICGQQGSEAIAVAHTADDQAEQVLLRLLRGSGRRGVSGMRMRAGDIIRPLLDTQKQVLLHWLADQAIPYSHDSSNNDLRFTRNRVRHRLLPFLEQEFDPHVRGALCKTALSLAEDEDLLEQLAREAFDRVVTMGRNTTEGDGVTRLARAPLRELHPSLQRRVVEHLLWRLGSRASYAHILLILDAARRGRAQSELHLGRGLRAGVFRDFLEFSYPAGRRPWRGRLLA